MRRELKALGLVAMLAGGSAEAAPPKHKGTHHEVVKKPKGGLGDNVIDPFSGVILGALDDEEPQTKKSKQENKVITGVLDDEEPQMESRKFEPDDVPGFEEIKSESLSEIVQRFEQAIADVKNNKEFQLGKERGISKFTQEAERLTQLLAAHRKLNILSLSEVKRMFLATEELRHKIDMALGGGTSDIRYEVIGNKGKELRTTLELLSRSTDLKTRKQAEVAYANYLKLNHLRQALSDFRAAFDNRLISE